MKGRRPGVVTLAVLTALTSLLWVFFSVFRALTEEADQQLPTEVLEPLDASLDLETLNKVRDGLSFSSVEGETISANTPTSDQESQNSQESTEIDDQESLEEGEETVSEDTSSGDSDEDFGVPDEDLQ